MHWTDPLDGRPRLGRTLDVHPRDTPSMYPRCTLDNPRQTLDKPSTNNPRHHKPSTLDATSTWSQAQTPSTQGSTQGRRTLDVPSTYPRRTLDVPSTYPRRTLDTLDTRAQGGRGTPLRTIIVMQMMLIQCGNTFKAMRQVGVVTPVS